MNEKLVTYLLNGVEVPAGTPGAVAYETAPIAPETGLYNGNMTKGSAAYRTAVFVDGGKVSADQSVQAAVVGGEITDQGVTGGKIDSDNKHFNGVMVNDSVYTVKDLTMTADGSGGNDFKGLAQVLPVTASPRWMWTALSTMQRALSVMAYLPAAPTRKMN